MRKNLQSMIKEIIYTNINHDVYYDNISNYRMEMCECLLLRIAFLN